MTELDQPSLWTRVAAGLSHEGSAEPLEAFRRAGQPVYAAYLATDKSYAELARAGTHPWDAPPSVAGQFLCTWNALVLQTLGEALLDADYAASPRTVGYLPRATAEQAWSFFAQVEPWLSRAQRAAASESYRVEDELALPAKLPRWIVTDASPPSHGHAMMAAARALGERLDAAFGTLAMAGPAPDGTREQADAIRGLAAAAQTDVSYAAALQDCGDSENMGEVIAQHLHRGLETQFLLGQALAIPYLVDRLHKPEAVDRSDSLPWPGQPGFDPWCLTSPGLRARLRSDRAARQAISDLWHYDPDPVRTIKIQRRIEAALRSKQIRDARQPDGTPLGAYFCCPWSGIYEVLRPLRIAGQRLEPLAQFTFYVSAEEMPKTGVFVRRILVGPFRASSKIDYSVGAAAEVAD